MSRALHLHGAAPEARGPGLAVAEKGFRPFFVLAAGYAVLIVPLWLAVIAGRVGPSAYLDPVTWHAHEMIFGFTVAVIAGFLLTAVGNWTGRETLVGGPLLALAGLWVLGRGAMALADLLPRGMPALIDLAFLPILIGVLARPLLAAQSRKNFVMLGILAALFAADVAIHLEGLGALPAGTAQRACRVAVDVVLLVIVVIAGRIFPMFTRNAAGVSSIRSIPALDVAAVAGMGLLTFLDSLSLPPDVPNGVAGAVGIVVAARATHWGAHHALREPLLWILHAGYAWLVLGLLLRGATALGAPLPGSIATHALTVGAVGSLTLGMMARVSLGHTGRPLTASPAMAWAFGAILLSAFTRTIVPVVAPGWYLGALHSTGALWTLAFVAFLVVYVPILTRPRVDVPKPAPAPR